jgi:protein-tyrosine phosphatase
LIDLHCHLLPAVDDGAVNLAESLEMARMAAADGVEIVACTPHIMPGVYDNKGPAILTAVAELQAELSGRSIPLALTTGADVHLAPRLGEGISDGRIPSLGGSRYFLLEPPPGLVPPRFEDIVFGLVGAGGVPVITHPERLNWPERDYGIFERLVRLGCWMQLTGGSLLGHFGSRVRAVSERMLRDGLIHIIASDAHDTRRRPPGLSQAFRAAAEIVGVDEALHLVDTRPTGILKDINPCEHPAPTRSGAASGWRLARNFR